MSQLKLSFNLAALANDELVIFMAGVTALNKRFFDLAEMSVGKALASRAETEDGGSGPAPSPAAEKALEEMSGQELRDILATLQGKPTGRKTSAPFGTKTALMAEIQRLRAEALKDVSAPAPAPAAVPAVVVAAEEPKKERKNPWAGLSEEAKAERIAKMQAGRQAKKAERKMSADSLDAPAPAALPAPVRTPNEGGINFGRFSTGTLVAEDAPAAPAPAEDAGSETSSKKSRKNPWEGLSEEQRKAKIAKMQEARAAKKAARAAAGAGSDSA